MWDSKDPGEAATSRGVTNPDVSEADVDESTSKKCTKCEQVKPLDEYHRRAGAKDGRRAQCKACLKAAHVARMTANPDLKLRQAEAQRERLRKLTDEQRAARRAKNNAYMRATYATRSERQKKYGNAWRKVNAEAIKAYRIAYRAANREALAEKDRAYREANSEKVRAAKAEYHRLNRDKVADRSRRWAQANPERLSDRRNRRRAQIAGSAAERVDVEALWTGICGICGDVMDASLRRPDLMSRSLDHIVPLARGGGHTRDNLQWAHFSCNARKGSRLPTEL